MFKQTPKKRVLFVRRFSPALLAAIGVFSLAVTNLQSPQLALAASSSTVNFQARLQNAAGGIAPDGPYNIEFKLYNAATSSGSSQGSCSGDSNCLWTETRISGDKVTVANGYLSVQLGSESSFSGSIDWSQELWLTMNIGGTGSPTWDGEMNPRLALTAVPYAFTAGQLQTTSGANTSKLSIQAPTVGNQTFVIQDQGAGGTYNLLTTNQADAGYIKLQGSTPGTAQTGSFNITGTGIAATLQAGTLLAPSLDVASGTLTIGGSNASTINIANNNAAHTIAIATGTGAQSVTIGSTDSTSALTLQAGTGDVSITGAAGTDYTIGSAAGTGTITIGQSTVSNIINIGGGTTSATNTQVVNIATSATSTGATAVNIGSTNAASQLTLDSGTAGTSLSSNGTTVFTTLTDSTDAFQIQNHDGSSNLLIADTTNTRIGIGMTNPVYTLDVAGDINTSGVYRVDGTAGSNTTCTGGEVLGNIIITGGIVTSGSCATNGGGVAPTLQDGYNNSASTNPQIQLGNGNGGLKIRDANSSSITNLFQIQNSTGASTYFSVTSTTVTAATFNATTGFSANGTPGANTTCSAGQFLQDQIVAGGITTGGTCAAAAPTIGTIDGGVYSANGASISGTTMYLQTASASQVGLVNIGTQTFAGAKTFTGDTLIKNTSTTGFQVQTGGSAALFTADTSTSTITLGSVASGNYITFDATNGLVANGTTRHGKTITLTPEYVGAVLDAAGDATCSSANSGTMTSGYDSTNVENYYRWTSSTTAQCYDVVVRVPIPADWASWTSTTPITVNGYTSSTSTGLVNLQVLKSTGGTAESSCNYANVTPGSTSTWSTANSSNCVFASTTTGYSAGGTMTLRLRMTGGTSSDVRIGNITLSYTSKF